MHNLTVVNQIDRFLSSNQCPWWRHFVPNTKHNHNRVQIRYGSLSQAADACACWLKVSPAMTQSFYRLIILWHLETCALGDILWMRLVQIWWLVIFMTIKNMCCCCWIDLMNDTFQMWWLVIGLKRSILQPSRRICITLYVLILEFTHVIF